MEADTHRHVCYVVGAGGSCAYGFPNGGELAQFIMALKADSHYGSRDRHAGFQEFRDHLEAANPKSIDDYIRGLFVTGNDPDNRLKEAAAYGVAVVIQQKQRQHRIGNDGKDDWITEVVHRHQRNLSTESESPEISFITFNYDLLIENYLEHRLRGWMGSEERAKRRVSQIPIVHVHGKLGPVVKPATSNSGIPGLVDLKNIFPFVLEYEDDSAYESSKSLRFLWETEALREARAEAIRVIGEATEIVVVGVGGALEPMISIVGAMPSWWWEKYGRFDMNCFEYREPAKKRLLEFLDSKGISKAKLPHVKARDFVLSLD